MSKLRKTKTKTGRQGKAVRNLNGRIEDWKNTTSSKTADAEAYRRPGRGY